MDVDTGGRATTTTTNNKSSSSSSTRKRDSSALRGLLDLARDLLGCVEVRFLPNQPLPPLDRVADEDRACVQVRYYASGSSGAGAESLRNLLHAEVHRGYLVVEGRLLDGHGKKKRKGGKRDEDEREGDHDDDDDDEEEEEEEEEEGEEEERGEGEEAAGIHGLVVAILEQGELQHGEGRRREMGSQLARLAPMIVRAYRDGIAEEERRQEQIGQHLIIDLCRDIQGERLDAPSSDTNIFAKGARHICELMAGSSCVILDVSDLRLFRGGSRTGSGTGSGTGTGGNSTSKVTTMGTNATSTMGSAGQDSSQTMGRTISQEGPKFLARSRTSTSQTLSSTMSPTKSEEIVSSDSLYEQRPQQNHHHHHQRSYSSSKDLSLAVDLDLDKQQELSHAAINTLNSHNDDDDVNGHDEGNGDDDDDDHDSLMEIRDTDAEEVEEMDDDDDDEDVDMVDSPTSDEAIQFESFVPGPASQIVCSYPTTGGPVKVLGSHGADAEALVSMPGDRIRPALARYLASSRNSGRDSRAYIETGSFDDEDSVGSRDRDAFEAPSSLRRMLGLGDDRSVMCAAIMEADSQPASVVVVLLPKGFNARPYYGIFLEQVGACLIYSVVRARADERDVAQSHFIQRVQHELRTPVHAILGVNETAKYALGQESNQNGVDESLRRELCELVDSVAVSADKLCTIVDDLVDFRLMVEGKKPGLVTGTAQQQKAAQGPSKMTAVSWDTVCAVVSSTVNQAWSLYRREALRLALTSKPNTTPPPPPELIFSTNYLHQDPMEWRVADVRLDLEVIKRIVWKVMMNAMQATKDGLITVSVHRRVLKLDTPSLVQKFELIISDTGHGMSSEFVDNRLFQPFSKEHAQSDGVGLSLSVCRSLVSQQGGRIFAQSTPEKGSKIIVSIPFTPRRSDGTKSTNADVWTKRRGSDTASTGSRTGSTASSNTSAAKVYFADFDGLALSMLRDRLVGQFGLRKHLTNNLNEANIIVVADIKPKLLRQRIIQDRQDVASSPVRVIYMPVSFQELSDEEERDLEQLRATCGGSGDDGGSGHVHVLPRPLTFAHLRRFDAICNASISISPKVSGDKSISPAHSLRAGGASSSMAQRRNHPMLKDMPATQLLSSSSPSSSSATPPSSSSSSPSPLRMSMIPSPAISTPLLVLVVEDNPLNAKILTTLLRRAEIKYIDAKNGREAVDKFERHRPRVVLLDINMPVMNGFDACKAMRSLQKTWEVPTEAHTIIAITALSSEADKLRGQEVGMDEWHTKPLRMSGLVTKLQRWRDNGFLALEQPSQSSPPPADEPLSPTTSATTMPIQIE